MLNVLLRCYLQFETILGGRSKRGKPLVETSRLVEILDDRLLLPLHPPHPHQMVSRRTGMPFPHPFLLYL